MIINDEYSAILVSGRIDRHKVRLERYAYFRTAEPARILGHINMLKGPTHTHWWSDVKVCVNGYGSLCVSDLLAGLLNAKVGQ